MTMLGQRDVIGAATARISLVACLLALALTTAVAGQFRPPPGLEEALEPDFVARDLRIFSQTLGLDDAQEQILAGLFEDYEASVALGTGEIRTLLSKANASDDRRVQQQLRRDIQATIEQHRRRREAAGSDDERLAIEREMAARIRQLRDAVRPQRSREEALRSLEETRARITAAVNVWKVQKDRLATEFMESVQAILSTAQTPKWPRLERALVRRRLLPEGRLSGESVDLLAVLQDVELTPAQRSALEPTVMQYEVELHDALQARERQRPAIEQSLSELEADGDVEEATRLADRYITLRETVRDVNDRFVETFSAGLPEPQRSSFARLAVQRGYARIFRRTRAERSFQEALRLPDLDPTTRTALVELQTIYLDELRLVNELLLGLVRQHEPDHQRSQLTARVRREGARPVRPAPGPGGGAGREPPEVRDAFQRRTELGRRYVDQIQAMLTEEQRAVIGREGRGVGAGAGRRGG